MRETWFDPWVGKIHWRRDRLPTPVFLDFPCGSAANLPAMQETWVKSLGWEDPLEKGKATHCSILAWGTPWTAWSMGLQSWTRLTDFHFISLQSDLCLRPTDSNWAPSLFTSPVIHCEWCLVILNSLTQLWSLHWRKQGRDFALPLSPSLALYPLS